MDICLRGCRNYVSMHMKCKVRNFTEALSGFEGPAEVSTSLA
jgi:hypothetical protein